VSPQLHHRGNRSTPGAPRVPTRSWCTGLLRAAGARLFTMPPARTRKGSPRARPVRLGTTCPEALNGARRHPPPSLPGGRRHAPLPTLGLPVRKARGHSRGARTAWRFAHSRAFPREASQWWDRRSWNCPCAPRRAVRRRTAAREQSPRAPLRGRASMSSRTGGPERQHGPSLQNWCRCRPDILLMCPGYDPGQSWINPGSGSVPIVLPITTRNGPRDHWKRGCSYRRLRHAQLRHARLWNPRPRGARDPGSPGMPLRRRLNRRRMERGWPGDPQEIPGRSRRPKIAHDPCSPRENQRPHPEPADRSPQPRPPPRHPAKGMGGPPPGNFLIQNGGAP
jgi:hypothetical protein